MNEYKPEEHNNFNYVEYRLTQDIIEFDERLEAILNWSNKLDEDCPRVSTEFTLTVRQIFSYNNNKVSDLDFVRLYRIYLKGGKE